MNHISANLMKINKNFKVLTRDKGVIAMKEIKLLKPKVRCRERTMKMSDE